ncbi:MAG TPA: hypothetical protein VLA36_04620 [Longimicrobiales bacterium]|nr:hypothetical protein [Longimicrobiales bacterium]
MPGSARGGIGLGGVLAVLVGVLAGCSLQEVTLVEAEDVVVAEVYVELVSAVPGRDRLSAFLHRTLEGGTGASRPVPGARVIVTRSDGLSIELAETALETCVVSLPVDGTGSCYWAAPELAARLEPGDALEVRIELPGGGLLRGAATVPGAFSLLTVPTEASCTVEPATSFEVRWTRSPGAWAYINETLISGLRAALEPRGIEVEEDPLYLLGLAVSAADTTIRFPSEFGVFDRFDLNQDLALVLQQGLPEGTGAVVSITAGERNYVNWARGGNFNPSGLVKIPSLRGDGTGVFAATVSQTFRVLVASAGEVEGIPSCGGG